MVSTADYNFAFNISGFGIPISLTFRKFMCYCNSSIIVIGNCTTTVLIPNLGVTTTVLILPNSLINSSHVQSPLVHMYTFYNRVISQCHSTLQYHTLTQSATILLHKHQSTNGYWAWMRQCHGVK